MSLFHKLKSGAQVAAQLTGKRGSNETQFVLGGHYALDKDSYLRAKVSHAQEVTASYTQVWTASVSCSCVGRGSDILYRWEGRRLLSCIVACISEHY